MAALDIICLANSRKHGGRCVAGLRTDGGGWLRPVGTLLDGTLYPPDYTMDDLTEWGCWTSFGSDFDIPGQQLTNRKTMRWTAHVGRYSLGR